MLLLVVVLRFISEHWWVTTALVYLPRAPYLLGSCVLLPLAILYSRRASLATVVALILGVWPVMGLVIPVPGWGRGKADPDCHLRVVTCNVHRYQPSFEGLMSEVESAVPDVVAFQEAFGEHPLLDKQFADWYQAHVGEYFIASRYRITHIATFRSEAYNRNAAMIFEIKAPRPFRLANVHQTSPRNGLTSLRPATVLDGSGGQEVERGIDRRAEEAAALRQFIADHCDDQPLLIVGDFNMPSDSSLYRASWGSYRNAFDAAGFGYGYTASCGDNRIWPDGTPWCRVDHILTTDDWRAQKCWVGSGNGSDHRLVAAILE